MLLLLHLNTRKKDFSKKRERERVKVNVEIELFVEGLYFVRTMNCRCVCERDRETQVPYVCVLDEEVIFT